MLPPTDRLRNLIAGKGPDRIKITLEDVDPQGNGGCRKELEAILIGHPEIGYAHDSFLDRWTLWRYAPADLFAGPN